MKNLTDVKERLVEVLDVPADMISLHTVARNNEFALGIYNRRGNRQKQEMLGGEGNRAHGALPVTILLRWGRDGVAAEAKAEEVYACLIEMGGIFIVSDGPVWLGADARGVFEYAVDIDFLSSVNASVRPHMHTISDITDLFFITNARVYQIISNIISGGS
jgi:hypothetical protein